ncbi:MAG: hypothetical protein OCD02_20635 [Spirochaetaceae bacterium]
MLIILLCYFIIYIVFILTLVPSGSLYYIRPLFISTLTILFLLFNFIIKKLFKTNYKKIGLPIFIFILNFGSIVIIGEFARISLKTSIILVIISSLIGLLMLLKYKTLKVIGLILALFLIILILWQGKKLHYNSNLEKSLVSLSMDIDHFEYGNGTNIKTYSIDSSSYYNGNSGLSDWYDKNYWKFSTNLPLNGKVYFPQLYGKYPLVLVVHGNHMAEDRSHHGYDYILKHLAQNGYIAVSIDQNFLNGNWTNLGIGQPRENDTRGYLILEHLKLFEKFNNSSKSILYKKIDMENIGLIGHSRGGEAISIAANKNKKYNIKALMAIAPTDYQFREIIKLDNISYLTIGGANDGDLESFKGRFQYNRVTFSNKENNFKLSYYIQGLNHSGFNSDWGKIDSTGLGQIFYGSNYTVKPEDQREISKQLSSLFFDIKLKDKVDLIPIIKNPKVIPTLPDISYIVDFYDDNTSNLYNFNNTKGIFFNNIEGSIIYHFANRVLELKWSKNGSVSFNNTNPETKMKNINISIGSKSNMKENINIEFYKDEKKMLIKQLTLQPQINSNIFKTDIFLIKKTSETHFQNYEIPIAGLLWDSFEIVINSDKGGILLDSISYQKIEL